MTTINGKDIRKLIVACDAGMGSSVMLASQLRKDLFSYRMKNYTNQLDDTSLLKKTRRDIARIEQILHERNDQEAAS